MRVRGCGGWVRERGERERERERDDVSSPCRRVTSSFSWSFHPYAPPPPPPQGEGPRYSSLSAANASSLLDDAPDSAHLPPPSSFPTVRVCVCAQSCASCEGLHRVRVIVRAALQREREHALHCCARRIATPRAFTHRLSSPSDATTIDTCPSSRRHSARLCTYELSAAGSTPWRRRN